jgi:hypothetical protein
MLAAASTRARIALPLAFGTLLACAHTETAPARPAPPPPNAALIAPAGTDRVLLIRSLCGMISVGNFGPSHFTVEVPGDNFQLIEGTEFMTVDNLAFNVKVTTSEDLGAAARGLRGQALLDFHRKWETDYLAEKFGRPMGDTKVIAVTNGQHEAIGSLWRVEFQPEDRTVLPGLQFLLYGTADVAGQVVVVTFAIPRGEELFPVLSRAGEVVGTLKASSSFLDSAPISADMKRRYAAGETCRRKR